MGTCNSLIEVVLKSALILFFIAKIKEEYVPL